MALALKRKSQNNSISRTAREGQRLLGRILEHNEERGAKSNLTLGQPESCKSAATCYIAEYFMEHHPTDYLFWRSAMNAPIQIFKLPKWHLFVEQDSGVHFFDRKTGKDITDRLVKEKHLTYFKTFNELLRKAKPGICNGVFFKDLHYKGIKIDEGTLQWFRFIRHLLHRIDWYHIFLDEYQEMVKAGSGERMHWEVDRHSNDVSSARKSNVGLHANAHQTTEVDWRVTPNFMLLVQMYGSRPFKHAPTTKAALRSLNKPTERLGAEAWISEGGHFGKVTFKKVYVIPNGWSIEARIIGKDEHTKVCNECNHIYIYKRSDQEFCSRACQERNASRRRKQKKKKPNA